MTTRYRGKSNETSNLLCDCSAVLKAVTAREMPRWVCNHGIQSHHNKTRNKGEKRVICSYVANAASQRRCMWPVRSTDMCTKLTVNSTRRLGKVGLTPSATLVLTLSVTFGMSKGGHAVIVAESSDLHRAARSTLLISTVRNCKLEAGTRHASTCLDTLLELRATCFETSASSSRRCT